MRTSFAVEASRLCSSLPMRARAGPTRRSSSLSQGTFLIAWTSSAGPRSSRSPVFKGFDCCCSSSCNGERTSDMRGPPDFREERVQGVDQRARVHPPTEENRAAGLRARQHLLAEGFRDQEGLLVLQVHVLVGRERSLGRLLVKLGHLLGLALFPDQGECVPPRGGQRVLGHLDLSVEIAAQLVVLADADQVEQR